MKKPISLILACLLIICVFAGCNSSAPSPTTEATTQTTSPTQPSLYEGTQIALSDSGITVDGIEITEDVSQAVYAARDIVYYEAGHDFTYGEGTENDAHEKEEADAHTVVHITKPGQYVLSGALSQGQIAVDLGDDAKDDPNAVVTLVLNGADITCQVAPAVIFYNVFECGSADTETASATVDTSKAGANVILADGTVSNINGSYVARIYKPGTVELSEDGTEVADAKKLHKYDGAFYSKMSMNILGDVENTGVLNIKAENEGMDSELHLTVNGGNINITSGNDGINTNEDGVSVTTVNGGALNILVDGSTGEGDGIDSNGWLVINGGSVIAQACGFSGDAGIDSDMGIHLNGGTVFATGNMLDRISESKQNFVVFQFAQSQKVSMYNDQFRNYTLKNSSDAVVSQGAPENDFTYMLLSSPTLSAGEYTLWQGDVQFAGASSQGLGGMGMHPGGMERPEGDEPPEDMQRPERPEDMTPPEGMQRPGDAQNPFDSGAFTHIFAIADGGNYFTVSSAVTAVPIQQNETV